MNKSLSPSYVELRCKTNFSFLRGASNAEYYVALANALGMPAVGIADVNGVYALPRAYEACKEAPPTRLISGAELVMKDHPPLTLIAQDRAAYAILCRIISTAHAGKEKGEALLTFSELTTHLEDSRARGLVCLPTLNEHTQTAWLKELFTDQLYFPLCRYLDGLDSVRSELCFRLAKQFSVEIVATNDVHYHAPERRRLQDLMVCIREGVAYRDAGFKLFGNEERYLKSPLQMRSLFNDHPRALSNTLEIAERCTFSLSELTYRYPSELIPTGHTPQSYFEELVGQGAHRIYRGAIPAAVDAQIQHEFKLIRKMNYASYFLTLYDIVQFAKSKDILCQGRGSAANSICCYCLEITAIDPVRMKLLFERFISEERSEPPDIDVDFEHERREEVIQYVYERYGRTHASMLCAVRTYQKRSAFLELSKAIGVKVGTISAQMLEQEFTEHAGDDANKRELIESLADELRDAPRHLSIHSGGFTLSADPIIETVPVEPARMENRTIVQWDKDDLDTTGLLKVDLLSLGFLTALHKICNLVGINWRDIPPEDPATYRMIGRAETEGTFQIESRAQKSMLPRSQPQTFYDLVVQVAIVRPGPNVGEMIHPYIKRREDARRGKIYKLADPDLQKILGRTYGVPIFQEQIMKLAIVKAGFSPGEADQLRRALASVRSAKTVEAMGERLYRGLIKNGVSKDYADELFGYVQGYSHYGFPESHAASFALITYSSAFLKCHYPAEFLCGLINSQPMGFYPVHVLIDEAKRNGVRVLPLDPNRSHWDAIMEGEKAVRMGFRNLRKVREEDITALVKERVQREFKDLPDFIKRTGLNRDVLEMMAMGDAFKSFGLDQRHSFWNSVEFKHLCQPAAAEQLSLLEENAEVQKPVPKFVPMTLFEAISADYRSLGYSLRGTLMRAVRTENQEFIRLSQKIKFLTSTQIKKLNVSQNIQSAGILIVIQRPPTAKGTCFITLEDEFGTIDLIVPNLIFEKFRAVIQNSRLLITRGRLQISGTGRAILVNSVEILDTFNSGRAVETGSHPRSLGAMVK